MANVSIDLSGALIARPAVCNGAPGIGNVGPVIQLGLRSSNRSAALEVSQIVGHLDSPDEFVALPWPADLHATIFYLRTADWPSGWSLRLTYEVSGTVTLPVHGAFGPIETPVDDRITGVELQGSGQYIWLAAGAIE